VRFHFLLTNHYPYGCAKIEDALVLIAAGLSELGHRVSYGFDDDVLPWPAVNLLVESFGEDTVVDQVINLRGVAQSRYCFGLLCPWDINAPEIANDPNAPRRGANLERLLPHLDFVWALVPSEFGGLVDPEQLHLLTLGYCAALQRDSALPRDIDVLFWGDLDGRRQEIFLELNRRGLSVDTTLSLMPEYIRRDLLDRAKLVVDVRMTEAPRFLSPDRLVAGIHSGAAIVCERFDPSTLCSLYRYVAPGAAAELADLCVMLLQSGKARELGVKARDLFASETSMAGNLRRAMSVPVFDALARS
jgi:hypothetical protein